MTIFQPPSVNAVQKTLDAQLLSGVTASMTLNNVTGIQNKAGVCVIDAVDANGNATPAKREYVSFTGVSGSTLTGLTRNADGGGTDQDHAVGAIVQFTPDVLQQQGLIDSYQTQHNDDGTHKSALVTTLKATGAEINTGTEDAKIVTPKAIADSTIAKVKATATENAAGTDDAKYLTALANVPAFNNSMARQAIINGNFDVWQRGTSVAMTAANAYTTDRWYCETATAGTDKTVSREDGTGVNGSYYCARVKMVSDVDELLTFSQALESQDSIKFRGQKVTLSFYARGGAEFVADNATLVSKIVTGKGTDQKVLSFTTSADGVSQNNTLTTSWQKFTCTTTAAIATDITQIGVSFAFTHAGSGTTTNYFEITQVQLCAGDVALPFMPKSYADELRACQRYFYKIGSDSIATYYATGMCNTTTIGLFVINFPVEMRIAPTSVETTGTATHYKILTSGDTNNVLNAVPDLITSVLANKNSMLVRATVASGLTAGQACLLSNNSANAYLAFSAEL